MLNREFVRVRVWRGRPFHEVIRNTFVIDSKGQLRERVVMECVQRLSETVKTKALKS